MKMNPFMGDQIDTNLSGEDEEPNVFDIVKQAMEGKPEEIQDKNKVVGGVVPIIRKSLQEDEIEVQIDSGLRGVEEGNRVSKARKSDVKDGHGSDSFSEDTDED